MDRKELQRIQLAIHDLINREDYTNALPLINTALEHYPDNDATPVSYTHLTLPTKA